MSRPSVLLVDDEPQVLEVIGRFATRSGFDVRPCSDGRNAIAFLQSHPTQLAFVDVNLPDVSGMDVFQTIREHNPYCQVVVMSGNVPVDVAVDAIKLGAIDFLSKPFDMTRLRDLLESRRRQFDQTGPDGSQDSGGGSAAGMIGRGPAMQRLVSQLRRAAPYARSVLVTGETGTGKELVARALHRLGPRSAGPFVDVNCAAVVETLFESELFGHRRGAFTGAVEHRSGLFDQAHGGTLFLDEIGELPLGMQAKLLRVLETGQYRPVGGSNERSVDVRVVAATNRHLRDAVVAGSFRSDLYYRLNVVEIQVPPLRDRTEDIPLLAEAFVRECVRRFEKPISGLTPAAEQMLMQASWDGNVREFRNVIERACILAESPLINERTLRAVLSPGPRGSAVPLELLPRTQRRSDGPPAESPDSLGVVEREHVSRVLAEVNGNKSEAAVRLGIHRRTLYRRLTRLGLDDESTRPSLPLA